MKEFDSSKNGDMHKEPWIDAEIKKFYDAIYSLKQHYCENCHELWPDTVDYCKQCKKDPIMFSKVLKLLNFGTNFSVCNFFSFFKLNDMVPALDDIPFEIKQNLENLTMIEEMLISPILAVMSVYRLPGGALINRGFVANFSQDVNEIIKELPRLPKDLPILVLKKKDQQNNVKRFMVNRKRVELLLTYLCENNPQYIAHGVKMNQSLLNSLPENGIPTELNEIDDVNMPDADNIISGIDNGPHIEEKDNEILINEVNCFV